MRRKTSSHVALKLPTITSEHLQRIKRASRRRPRHQRAEVDVGMNVTIAFRKNDLLGMEAFAQRVSELSRRCGPRHGSQARQKTMLTEADQVALREAQTGILSYLDEKPEHAALFAFDPLCALKQMEIKLKPELLAKLRILAEMARTRAKPVPKVTIGRMVARVEQDKGPTLGVMQAASDPKLEK
ncbi:MAG: hypothetical protein ABW076_10615 [Candidatus Thiodiazotropha sp.]